MFQSLIDWYMDYVYWFFDLVRLFILAFLDMLNDLFLWVASQFLGLILWVLEQSPVDCSSWSLQDSLEGMPWEVLNIMYVLAFPQALTIILTAFSAKLVLRLIPFNKLGI